MTDAKATAGAALARPEEIDAIRERMAATRWSPADVARVDGPVLVEMEALLAQASSLLAQAEAQAERLMQKTVAQGGRAAHLPGAVATAAKAVNAARAVAVAVAQHHAQAQKG